MAVHLMELLLVLRCVLLRRLKPGAARRARPVSAGGWANRAKGAAEKVVLLRGLPRGWLCCARRRAVERACCLVRACMRGVPC